MTITSQDIQNIVIVGGFVGAAFVYFKGHVPQQTIKNLEESNKSYIALDQARQSSIRNLETKIDEIVKAHADEVLNLNKSMAELQGQVKVYKELPLRELADGIKRNNDISTEILNQLKSTATIAAEDRDVLTNQNLHIKTEVHKVMDKDVRPKT